MERRGRIFRIGTLALTTLCPIEYMYETASVKLASGERPLRPASAGALEEVRWRN